MMEDLSRRSAGRASGSTVAVLCYHAIADLAHDATLRKFGVPRDVLRRQLLELKQAGYRFLHPEDFQQFLTRGTVAPPRSLLITFDDCYSDLLEAALPVLREFDAPALAFAVSRRLGGINDWDLKSTSSTLRLLSVAELKELTAYGIEIGAHSRTHPKLRRVRDADLIQEIAGSRGDLIEAGFAEPRFFAYPHGSYDGRMYPILERAGYVAAFGIQPGIATPASNRWAIPRVTVTPDDVGWRLRAKLTLASARLRWAVEVLQRMRGIYNRRIQGSASSA